MSKAGYKNGYRLLSEVMSAGLFNKILNTIFNNQHITMELPYNGRATVTDNFDQFQIIIPSRKNWFVLLFLILWLGGWVMGESFATAEVTHGNNNIPDHFLYVWLCGWTIGGIVVIRIFLWSIFGKEVIEAGKGQLSISKKMALFVKPKTYDLNECKNFRVQDEGKQFESDWGIRKNPDLLNFADDGIIRFDYGMKTVKFGSGLNEDEAIMILKKLRDKRILTDKNFTEKS